jgi:flavin reductase (DIM6/NTAB) family NADH-FMN oxidoreductase RutF
VKKSLGPKSYLFPLPTIVVGSYDQDDRPNMMTASWIGIVNSDPVMISVSLRKATYSYDSLLEKKAFTLSVPSKQHIAEMDYVGTLSGRKRDKFADTGLTAIKSDLIDAPYVAEFPVVLECKLVKSDDLGLHTMFVAEVLDVKIDQDYLKDNGMPDVAKLAPISFGYGDREYYELGDYAGAANRLWQVSLLNDKFDPTERELLERIIDYYAKLDRAEALEKVEGFFDWDNVQIVDAEGTIDNREDYARWYENNNERLFDRKHILEKISIEALSDNKYCATIDVYFRARSREPNQPVSKLNEVRSIVKIVFTRDLNDRMFRVYRYSTEKN